MRAERSRRRLQIPSNSEGPALRRTPACGSGQPSGARRRCVYKTVCPLSSASPLRSVPVTAGSGPAWSRTSSSPAPRRRARTPRPSPRPGASYEAPPEVSSARTSPRGCDTAPCESSTCPASGRRGRVEGRGRGRSEGGGFSATDRRARRRSNAPFASTRRGRRREREKDVKRLASSPWSREKVPTGGRGAPPVSSNWSFPCAAAAKGGWEEAGTGGGRGQRARVRVKGSRAMDAGVWGGSGVRGGVRSPEAR